MKKLAAALPALFIWIAGGRAEAQTPPAAWGATSSPATPSQPLSTTAPSTAAPSTPSGAAPPGATSSSPPSATSQPSAQPAGAAAAPDSAPAGASAGKGPRRRWDHRRSFVTWDLNLEGGLGHAFHPDPAEEGFSGFARVRGGVTYVSAAEVAAPTFLSAGFFADASNLEREVMWGLQGEALSLNTGLWLQLGVGIDADPHPVLLGSVGWSVFGVEAQARWDAETGGPTEGPYPVVLGKLRIPIGIAFAASR